MIPDVAVIAESDSTLPVCITMTTNPPRGIIAKEVELLLYTIDGTGEVPFSTFLGYSFNAQTRSGRRVQTSLQSQALSHEVRKGVI